MLIMPTTTTDFQALADGIVDDFFRNDVALTDGIAKVAVDREFTPEEVTTPYRENEHGRIAVLPQDGGG